MSIQIHNQKLKDRIRYLKTKPFTKPETIKWMSELSDAIDQELSRPATTETDHLIEIIRKQALIIEAAGILWPTIAQPIEMIWQCRQSSLYKDIDQPITDTITIPYI